MLLSALKALLFAARRSTPTFLLPLLVRIRTRRRLRDPETLAAARWQMEFVLGTLRPDADIDAASRAHVERMVWRSELRWHPELICNQEVDGLDNLRATLAQGRGALLVFMHHGQYDGYAASMSRHGVEIHGIVHPKMLTEDAPRWKKQHLAVLARGGTMHSAAIGSSGIADLLKAGLAVGIACDVPGRTPMTFLGNRVLGSSGAVHLAMGTGAPILVLATRCGDDGKPVTVLQAPLRPEEFESADLMLGEVLRRHEEAILAWPEMIDSSTARMTHLDDEGQPITEVAVKL